MNISLIIGTVLSGLGVAIGAFGAHGLKNILELNNRIDTFETAVKYHMYHSLALILVGIIRLIKPEIQVHNIGYLFLAGIVIFSGSLYILSITNLKWLGAITPIGGALLIVGWVLLTIKVINI